MMKVVFVNGWLDECVCVFELLIGFKWVGVDGVLIYFVL